MNNTFATFLLPVLMIVVFYFILIRPQQKMKREHVSMINALKKGDQVTTIGGLHGSVVDLTDDTVSLKVNDSTRLVFDKSSVRSVKTEENK